MPTDASPRSPLMLLLDRKIFCSLTLASLRISGDGGVKTKGTPSRCSGAVAIKPLKLFERSVETVILVVVLRLTSAVLASSS